MQWLFLRVIFIVTLLTGCSGPYVSDMIRQPVVQNYPGIDVTYLNFRSDLGFTVEYFSGDGQIMLWVPGTYGLVIGTWLILGPTDHPKDIERLWSRQFRDAIIGEFSRREPIIRNAASKICRNHTDRPGAPVTSMNWTCLPIVRSADSVVSQLTGDPFGLATQKRPAALFERCVPPVAFRLLKDVAC